MRKILTFFFLLIGLTSFGQTNIGFDEFKLTLNMESINEIYIAAYCSPVDSCRGTPYLLDYDMTEDLIDKLNKSNSKGPCIDTVEYILNIYFKDGTRKDYKINGPTIRENIDKCFEIDDSDYFENLWIELDEIWVELNKK